MEQEIDRFIRFLATERGLSENYQLSTRRSLTDFADWSSKARKITAPREVTLALISDYLATQKKRGLATTTSLIEEAASPRFFCVAR